MKRFIQLYLIIISSVFASDVEDLKNVWFYGVNYYKKDGSFKKLLRLKEREEIIEKFGDRRRWFVSKWEGRQPAIYVSASYNGIYDLENNHHQVI